VWQKRAFTDPLSELANRAQFELQLAEALQTAAQTKLPVSLAMLDIDHFKKVNDTWGHASGDMAIKLVAKLMRDGSRSYDLPSRLGGEEFCILLPQTSGKTAVKVMERLRLKLASTAVTLKDNHSFNITASIGVIEIDAENGDAENALADVDAALYKAKSLGRNCVYFAPKHNH
jgi:diguanylate cyclase (GGDEF)-like protein